MRSHKSGVWAQTGNVRRTVKGTWLLRGRGFSHSFGLKSDAGTIVTSRNFNAADLIDEDPS